MGNANRSAEIRGVILDMDGVLWREYQAITDLPAAFQRIDAAGWKKIFLTNNSTKAPEQYVELFHNFGVNLESWQVVSSSEAAAVYLQSQLPEESKVCVVGEEGLFQTLERKGFLPYSTDQSENEFAAVVVGLDRELNYQKIALAANHIRSGALFIGTNPDTTFPAQQGLMPGAGTVIKAVETAAGQPPVMIGKPAERIFRTALDRLQCPAENVLMIGDRLETDILGAQQIGCRTAVVLSGIASRQEAESWQPDPDWIAEDLSSLLDDMINA